MTACCGASAARSTSARSTTKRKVQCCFRSLLFMCKDTIFRRILTYAVAATDEKTLNANPKALILTLNPKF